MVTKVNDECIDELLRFEGVYRGWGVTEVNMGPSNVGEKARGWIKRGRYIPGLDHFVLDKAGFAGWS